MERERRVPGAPKYATEQTWAIIANLATHALASIPPHEVSAELEAAYPFASYLITTEVAGSEPFTLIAGQLVCRFTVVYGERALELEDPASPRGASSATDWSFHIPVPAGAPFTAADVGAAGPHLRAGVPEVSEPREAPDVPGLRDVVDLEHLRRATQK